MSDCDCSVPGITKDVSENQFALSRRALLKYRDIVFWGKVPVKMDMVSFLVSLVLTAEKMMDKLSCCYFFIKGFYPFLFHVEEYGSPKCDC